MGLREANIAQLDGGTFDVLIIGGGINGAVSAAALASRGARVAVIDRGDFADFTSMQSSNLVWAGWHYMENYELKLVRDLCMSRNHLIKAYPRTQRDPVHGRPRRELPIQAVVRGSGRGGLLADRQRVHQSTARADAGEDRRERADRAHG